MLSGFFLTFGRKMVKCEIITNEAMPLKILGLIPARGGSKRVPRKNIKPFLGQPLLWWTVKAAFDSGVLIRLVLSTDDQEIAALGKGYGAEVPFLRPAELAQDTTGALPVVKHALQWLKDRESYQPDWVIFLEPSSPGRQPFHIREVVGLLNQRSDIDSVAGVSVVPGHFNPLKILKTDEQGLVSRYNDGELVKNLTHRNQDLPELYFINSNLYAFKTSNIFQEPASLWGEKTFGYLMDERYALDIDTPEDWVVAEAKMRQILQQATKP